MTHSHTSYTLRAQKFSLYRVLYCSLIAKQLKLFIKFSTYYAAMFIKDFASHYPLAICIFLYINDWLFEWSLKAILRIQSSQDKLLADHKSLGTELKTCIKALTSRFDSLTLEISNIRYWVTLLDFKVHAFKLNTSNTLTVPSTQMSYKNLSSVIDANSMLLCMAYPNPSQVISLLKLTTIKSLYVIYI
jgi:hypothetical protein